ncbi:MAG: hypothetical protein JXA62_01360 [Candidatus Aminicenantes bacterium]|nr:hypothetical protein [Candidatus Aminicenantes bacterium]
MENRFSDFARMSETLGNQLGDVYGEVMDAEWQLRYRESWVLEQVNPRDLEPRVFNENRRRNREKAIEFLATYPALLLSLIRRDHMEELDRQADRVRRDLVVLQQHGSGWISPPVAGVAAALVNTIPHLLRGATTYKLVRRLMHVNDEVFAALCRELEADLWDCRLWVERCFSRRFRWEVSDAWPDQPSGRERVAKAGMKLLQKRDSVLALLDQSIAVLPELCAAHTELMLRVRSSRGIWPAMRQLAAALDQLGQCLEACREKR